MMPKVLDEMDGAVAIEVTRGCLYPNWMLGWHGGLSKPLSRDACRPGRWVETAYMPSGEEFYSLINVVIYVPSAVWYANYKTPNDLFGEYAL